MVKHSNGIIEEHEIGGLNFGLQGCSIQDQSITCHLLLTNNEFDRSIGFCGISGCTEGEKFKSKVNR